MRAILEIRRLVFFALIIMGAISGGFYFYMTSTPEPSPSHSPTPTPTQSPTPTPGPSTRFEYDIIVDFAASKGFNITKLEDVNREINTLFVLPPGETGSIPITISSTGEKSYNLSMSMGLAGEAGETFYGLQYTFTPSTLFLRAGGQERSILIIEAEKDAPAAYYETSVEAFTGIGGIGVGGPTLLVASYTPTFMYHVYVPTPGMPGPSPPGAPEGTSPRFEIASGENIRVMLLIMNVREPISFDIISTPEIGLELLPYALEAMPRPESDKLYLLTTTEGSITSKGTYEITVNGTVGSYVFGRTFTLLVN